MGRRKGSKNKPKGLHVDKPIVLVDGIKRGRGRPKGSLNKKTLIKLGIEKVHYEDALGTPKYAGAGTRVPAVGSTQESKAQEPRRNPESLGGSNPPSGTIPKKEKLTGVNDFYERHKGPYQFNVTRQTIKGKTKELSSHFLPEYTDGEDVQAEAEALLTDPRDTIISVNVWSVKEEQFVTSFR